MFYTINNEKKGFSNANLFEQRTMLLIKKPKAEVTDDDDDDSHWKSWLKLVVLRSWHPWKVVKFQTNRDSNTRRFMHSISFEVTVCVYVIIKAELWMTVQMHYKEDVCIYKPAQSCY